MCACLHLRLLHAAQVWEQYIVHVENKTLPYQPSRLIDFVLTFSAMTSCHVVIKYERLKISFTNDKKQYLAAIESNTRKYCSIHPYKYTNTSSPRCHNGLDTSGTSQNSSKALSPKYWKSATRGDRSKDHYCGIHKVDE